MAKKVKLTRPELKRQREALSRFRRYLPMLKLKQQQLQVSAREVGEAERAVRAAAEGVRRRIDVYRGLLGDRAGLNVEALSRPREVLTGKRNIAGVSVPVFVEARFDRPGYSLFATPPWVDRALADLRELAGKGAEADILRRQLDLLVRELTRIVQRVNLFEEVLIPRCRENIRVIRIRLGDEMAAAVGRAKIAKSKIAREAAAFDAAGKPGGWALAVVDEGGPDAPGEPGGGPP